MKSYIALILIFFSALSVKAQDERLITQLKNGTAPGLLFDRNAPAIKPANTNNTEQKESLIAQIRKANAPGMKFMAGSAANSSANRSSIAPGAQAGTLASELEIKKEIQKTIIASPVISNQEEVKKEAVNGKQ
jgi:hypothetical protein